MLRLLAAVLFALALVAGLPGVASGSDETSTRYYLALGDSIAQGFQPDFMTPYYREEGYVPLLHAALAATDRKLVFNNISCGGESTVSMIEGSQSPDVALSCGSPHFYRSWYPRKTQLAEAVKFLEAHAKSVALVTIDIGGNDLLVCEFAPDPDACRAGYRPQLVSNLNHVLDQLQAAAPGVRIVGMTYYNPFACLSVFGDPQTASFLGQQVQLLNGTLEAVYADHGIAVADVAGAFGVGDPALETASALNWTWFCSADHFGDVHPNDAGYQIIRDAFLAVP